MIKIAFTSIFYPVFMGRYILEALLRRKDCQVWTAGPFSGRWIPWNGGMNLPQEYVYSPDLVMPLAKMQLPYSFVENQCPFEPDIWIEVNSTLNGIGRPTKGKGTYAIVGTDPHVINYDHHRAKADLFFCMQKPYMKPGDHWLPYGYDPVWHSQTTIPAAERDYDAALLGLHYETRNALVARLRSMGLKVCYQLGPAYDDAKKIYHESRVGLNWSSKQDTTARVFELMAFGIAPVLNRVPDLMLLFQEGEHFQGFESLDDAVRKIEILARNPEMCDELGRNARLAVQPHSWDARVHQILEVAGLVSG
jgi:glycosyltransferase involved in cell wall biosynthesis